MVHIKKKVTIKTKVLEKETSDPVEKVVVNPIENPNKPEEPLLPGEGGKTPIKKWWLVVLLIFVVGVAAVLIYKYGNRTDEPVVGDVESETLVAVGDAESEATIAESEEEQPSVEQNDNAVTENEENVNADESVTSQPSAEKPAQSNSKSSNQNQVKSKANTTNSGQSNLQGDVEENALRVIRGEFGNGQERKDKLGSSYNEIQSKVNEMYRNGLVK